MLYATFESLIQQLADPRVLRLNYSGESTVCPSLIRAFQLARSTGASVELVSALTPASDSMLSALNTSGLNRLTVSVHAADAEPYREIYRYGSAGDLHTRLIKFRGLCNRVPNPPILDFAFVAMEQNLAQLCRVADLANSVGVRAISVFPVIRRDKIPIQFHQEFTANEGYRPEFRDHVAQTLAEARRVNPEIEFTVCDPSFLPDPPALGEAPIPFPGMLPADARIHSCEQNSWETVYVLSNGDVVACEVLDKVPLGNPFTRFGMGSRTRGIASVIILAKFPSAVPVRGNAPIGRVPSGARL